MTHCYIAIYKKDKMKLEDFHSLIFQHYDGYPEGNFGMEKKLSNFFSSNIDLINMEPSNLSALLLYFLMCDFQKRAIKGKFEDSFLEAFSIEKSFYISASYLYKIFPKKYQIFEYIGGTKIWKLVSTHPIR